jgi:hypothetical protein
MTDAKKEARDKRLDGLKNATVEWADKEIERIKNEAKFLKQVMDSRTGAGKLANQNVSDSSKVVVDAINAFLEG